MHHHKLRLVANQSPSPFSFIYISLFKLSAFSVSLIENMKAIRNHQVTLGKFSGSSFLKMATKFLVPVSVFSVVVSYTSLLPLLLHFYNFCFSAYTKQLLGYNIDKNWVFLLCNGILVFIVKNSGIVNKSPEETDFIAKNGIKSRDLQQQVAKVSEMKESTVEKKIFMEVEETQDTENVLSVAHNDEPKERENESLIIHEEEGEEEEEEEEEEEIGLLSTEELNKKCDDFIRRMKLGIKFEAQKLIMV